MSRRLLIADDSILIRRMIGDTLTDSGWTVVAEASDGLEAIEAYKTHSPDAMTLDIVMPGNNGMTALEEILRYDPDAYILVISALNRTKLISEAIRKGAQDFLVKPFLPEQLQAAMENCLAEQVSGD